jgi:hypothetical protein
LILAAESDLDTHEVFYIASPDNLGNRPFEELLRHHHGDEIELRELAHPHAPGLSIEKARRLLKYDPQRSWRDYLTEDGELLDAVRERLDAGDTGVQRGRAIA